MMKFLRALVNAYENNTHTPKYDEDGQYMDPRVAHLDDKTLTISADNARIMMTKGIEEARLKERRRIFRLIHASIKNGKTKIRLESHMANAATLTYFAELGYTINTVTPNAAQGGGFDIQDLDAEGDEIPASGRPYFYYHLSWGEDTPAPPTGASVIPMVPAVSVTAEVLAALSTEG